MSNEDYREIYLEPSKCACPESGRLWCEDSQSCDNCGKPWIRYIRADLTGQRKVLRPYKQGKISPEQARAAVKKVTEERG